MTAMPKRKTDQGADAEAAPVADPRGALDRICDWLLAAGAPSTLAGGGPDSLRELHEAVERLDGKARELTAGTTKLTRTDRRE